ncbi:MAG: helix-turn-helix transcriptional regulator [Actinobacteria bacterium]|nr:helix-turn-helix transcriptional regulator [Actinomycetota bacterium]
MIAIDASDRDALGFISFPVVAIAAVVTSKRWLAATMAVAIAGYAAGLVASGASLDSLTHGRPFNELANEAFDLILVAIVAQGVVGIMRRALRDAPANLGSVRRGGASLTPELATAVRRGSQRQLSRGDPAAIASTLSHSEHQVVEILRAGLLPKQAASELGVSLATVRTHIANAKRKSGARTVEQLVGLIAEAGASTRAAVTPTELADD